jgi:hypothetical protein
VSDLPPASSSAPKPLFGVKPESAPQGPGWWQANDGNWYPPYQPPRSGRGVSRGVVAAAIAVGVLLLAGVVALGLTIDPPEEEVTTAADDDTTTRSIMARRTASASAWSGSSDIGGMPAAKAAQRPALGGPSSTYERARLKATPYVHASGDADIRTDG